MPVPELSHDNIPSGDFISYNVALQGYVLCRYTVLVGDLHHDRNSRNSFEPQRTGPHAFA